jgi:hypothetical protein
LTTKLYLHAADQTSSGTLPQVLSTGTWAANHITGADAVTKNRSMNTTIGISQATIAGTSTADTAAHSYYFAKWCSPPLNQTSVAANTWTFNIGAATSNASGAFGSGISATMYVWRPSNSTKIGDLHTFGTGTGFANVSTINTEKAENGTYTGSSVTCQVGDVIVVELFIQVTQGAAVAATDTFYFDGTTETTVTNTTVSSQAAFLSTPENISFSGGLTSFSLNQTVTISDSKLRNPIPSIASQTTSISEGTQGFTELFTAGFWNINAPLSKVIPKIATETKSISESIGKLCHFFRNPIETKTISDSKVRKPIPYITTESKTISGIVAYLRKVPRTLTETSIISSGSINKLCYFFRTLTETKSISSILSKKILIFKSIIETSIASQALSASYVKSEYVAISGIVSISMLHSKLIRLIETTTVSEGIIGFTDYFTANFWSVGAPLRKIIPKITTETTSISSSVGKLCHFFRTLAETRTISQAFGASKLVREFIVISDSLLGLKGSVRIRAITEAAVSISETLTRFPIFIRTLIETKAVSDGSGFTTGFTTGYEQITGIINKITRQLVETKTITDFLNNKIAYMLLEIISVSDKQLRTVIRNIDRVRAGLAGISQNVAGLRKFVPTINNETTSISDGFDKLCNLSTNLIEDIAIVETFLRNIIPKVTTQTSTISDALTSTRGKFKALTETVVIADSQLRNIKRNIIAQTTTFAESLLRRVKIPITQTTSLSDVLYATIHGIKVFFYDAVEVVESSTLLLRTSIPYIIAETIAVAESQLSTIIPFIANDVVDIFETLASQTARIINDTVTTIDTLIKKSIPKLTAETITISDLISIPAFRMVLWLVEETSIISETLSRLYKGLRNFIEGPCSLAFNGLTDYVEISGTGTLINSVTITAWVKFLDGEGGYGGIISYINNNIDNRLILSEDNKTILWELDLSGSGLIDMSYTMSDPGFVGDWHHFAASYNGAQMKLYIDGSSVGSPVAATGSIISSSGLEQIGWGSNSLYHLNGNIAEVAQYNVALTDTEVSDIFTNGTKTVTRGQTHYWKFNEGSGSMVKDSIGTRNGTIISSESWSTDLPTPIPTPTNYIGYISDSIKKNSIVSSIVETISSADSLLRTVVQKLSHTTIISESVGKLSHFFRTITETKIISDVLQGSSGVIVSLAETISTAESLLRKTIPNIPSEVSSILESSLRSFIPYLHEVVNVIDLALCKNEDLNTAWERTTGTDSMLRNIIPILTDTVNITEKISRFRGYIISEITVISDSLGRVAKFFWAFGELHSINDVIQATKGIFSFFAISETVAITTSLLRSIAPAIQSEVSTILELLTNLRSVLRSSTDTTTISSVVKSKVLRPFIETITIIETQLRKSIPRISTQTTTISTVIGRKIPRPFIETVSIIESTLRNIRHRLSTETVSISESQIRKVIPKIATQVMTILESLKGPKGAAITLLEIIGISDTISKVASYFMSISQTITIIETRLRIAIPRINTQSISTAESIRRAMTRQISDILTVSETQLRNVIPRIAGQTVNVAVGTISKFVIRLIPLNEISSIAESVRRKLFRPIIESSLSISDILRRKINRLISSQTISISDLISKLVNYFRTITQTTTILENLSVGKNRVAIVITETINIVTESIQRGITRIITQNVSTLDSISILRTAVIFLTEIIRITDVFARLPGVLFKIKIKKQHVHIKDGGFIAPKGPSWRWLFSPWRNISFTNIFDPDRRHPHIEPAAGPSPTPPTESMSTKPHTGRKSSFTNSFTPKMRGRE